MPKIKDEINQQKFNEIYDNYKDSIFSFCMARLHCDVNDSEDCMQETFTVIYKRIAAGESFENPRAFLYKTASNLIKKQYEKSNKKTKNELSFDEAESTICDDIAKVDDRILTNDILQKVKSVLNEKEQELFYLRFVEYRKLKEIADIKGINENACATQLSRMKRKLKQVLWDYLERRD